MTSFATMTTYFISHLRSVVVAHQLSLCGLWLNHNRSGISWHQGTREQGIDNDLIWSKKHVLAWNLPQQHVSVCMNKNVDGQIKQKKGRRRRLRSKMAQLTTLCQCSPPMSSSSSFQTTHKHETLSTFISVIISVDLQTVMSWYY